MVTLVKSGVHLNFICYDYLCYSGFIKCTEVIFKRQQVKGTEVGFNFTCLVHAEVPCNGIK